MATMVGTQHDLVSLLRQLVELDFDAIEAYRAAVMRLKSAADRGQLSQFMADHERHVRELSSILDGMGTRPPDGPDIKRVVTKGMVLIGAAFGDRAILRAMKTNEDDTNVAYGRAATRNDLPQAVREILARNLEDERRHRAWIEDRLAQRPAGVQPTR